ncbi:MAG: hypothetical protein ACOYON_06090 [Fimbriimonas sp.]
MASSSSGFKHKLHVWLERFPTKQVGHAGLVLGLLATVPPTIYLLEWELKHVVLNIAFLMLTPIFGTTSKIFAGAAYARDRDWRRTAITLVLVGAGTILLIAFGKLANITIRL